VCYGRKHAIEFPLRFSITRRAGNPPCKYLTPYSPGFELRPLFNNGLYAADQTFVPPRTH
jgi:hypothetical protein